MCRAGEVSVHRTPNCERATQPYSIGGGGGMGGGGRRMGVGAWVRFVQRSPRIITECLLTRSMLIKIYVHAIYS